MRPLWLVTILPRTAWWRGWVHVALWHSAPDMRWYTSKFMSSMTNLALFHYVIMLWRDVFRVNNICQYLIALSYCVSTAMSSTAHASVQLPHRNVKYHHLSQHDFPLFYKLKTKNNLKLFESLALRRIRNATGQQSKLHNEKLNKFCYSPNVTEWSRQGGWGERGM